jgi:hypothetical protein
MRRVLALVLCPVALMVALAFAACGDDPGSSAATPKPTLVDNPKTRILQPADKARDTVDQLNDQLNRENEQTGGGY